MMQRIVSVVRIENGNIWSPSPAEICDEKETRKGICREESCRGYTLLAASRSIFVQLRALPRNPNNKVCSLEGFSFCDTIISCHPRPSKFLPWQAFRVLKEIDILLGKFSGTSTSACLESTCCYPIMSSRSWSLMVASYHWRQGRNPKELRK